MITSIHLLAHVAQRFLPEAISAVGHFFMPAVEPKKEWRPATDEDLFSQPEVEENKVVEKVCTLGLLSDCLIISVFPSDIYKGCVRA